jgi:hypothetical protein
MTKALLYTIFQWGYFILVAVPLAIALVVTIIAIDIFNEIKKLIWGNTQSN